MTRMVCSGHSTAPGAADSDPVADTAELIQESFDRAEAASQQVDQVSAAIQGIAERVTKARGLVEEVTTATAQQAQGIHQVSQAVATMERVTQTSAASAEVGAAAGEELNDQARSAKAVARQLESLVCGSNDGGVAAAA